MLDKAVCFCCTVPNIFFSFIFNIDPLLCGKETSSKSYSLHQQIMISLPGYYHSNKNLQITLNLGGLFSQSSAWHLLGAGL